MAQVSFFTPVYFGIQPKSRIQSLLETVDSYFYLGGKKAYVILDQAQQGHKEAFLQTHATIKCLTVAIKVLSYVTVIMPAIMLTAKIVLRSTHTFHLIQDLQQNQDARSPQGDSHRQAPALTNAIKHLTAQEWLEEGINISSDTIKKIEKLLTKILLKRNDAEIKWYTSSGTNLIFSLNSIPNLIFKTANPNVSVFRAGKMLSAEKLTQLRFANMVKAVEVCLINQLNLLVIPHATKFDVRGITIIAEERLEIVQNDRAQEEFYRLPGLDETARQVATFIAKTDFSDVEWRNMPVIDTAPEFADNRRIALVDLEEMDSAAIGIFGEGYGRSGLVNLLHSETQIDSVLEEARRQGISSKKLSATQVKAKRMEEIKSDQQLYQFYTTNGILENPRKPIQVDDLTTLGLNLEEEETVEGEDVEGEDEEIPPITLTLRTAVEDVITLINKAINKTPNDTSVKGKRHFLLNHNNNRLLMAYNEIGLPHDRHQITKEEEQQVWLRRIINALVAKGHLFKLEKADGHGYLIQA